MKLSRFLTGNVLMFGLLVGGLWGPARSGGSTLTCCLVVNHGVGSVRPGMSADEMFRVCGHKDTKLVDLQLEGFFSPALMVQCDGHSVTAELTMSQNVWTVFRIRLTDPCFHTREGIAIGSTFEAIKRAYPDVSISSGEGREFAQSADKAVSFQMSSPVGSLPRANDKVVAIVISGM